MAETSQLQCFINDPIILLGQSSTKFLIRVATIGDQCTDVDIIRRCMNLGQISYFLSQFLRGITFYRLIFKYCCTGNWCYCSRDSFQQAALATAIGANNRCDLTFFKFHRHIVQNLLLTVRDGNMVKSKIHASFPLTYSYLSSAADTGRTVRQ